MTCASIAHIQRNGTSSQHQLKHMRRAMIMFWSFLTEKEAQLDKAGLKVNSTQNADPCGLKTM